MLALPTADRLAVVSLPLTIWISTPMVVLEMAASKMVDSGSARTRVESPQGGHVGAVLIVGDSEPWKSEDEAVTRFVRYP